MSTQKMRFIPDANETPDDFVRRHNFPHRLVVDAQAPMRLSIFHRHTEDTPRCWPFTVRSENTWRI